MDSNDIESIKHEHIRDIEINSFNAKNEKIANLTNQTFETLIEGIKTDVIDHNTQTDPIQAKKVQTLDKSVQIEIATNFSGLQSSLPPLQTYYFRVDFLHHLI